LKGRARKYLHNLVVHGEEVPENVQISGAEDQRIQKLGLQRNACQTKHRKSVLKLELQCVEATKKGDKIRE
jgi:hypothetical protein